MQPKRVVKAICSAQDVVIASSEPLFGTLGKASIWVHVFRTFAILEPVDQHCLAVNKTDMREIQYVRQHATEGEIAKSWKVFVHLMTAFKKHSG